MPDKKYALHPGEVTSKTDGDQHYLTSGQLANLYRVPLNECVVIDIQYRNYDRLMDKYKDLIHLYPDYSGEYKIPAVTPVALGF